MSQATVARRQAETLGTTCPLCRHKGTPDMPLGENAFFECSHVDCPNRRKVTAAPSDRVPQPLEKQ